MFALVDCNNFYVSCERLFRPDLRQRPVIVLSNNDGCVISRSAEAKLLGIPMGEPAYRLRPLIRQGRVTVFSSNYALYADISSRVMQTLEAMAPEVEVYSIDEAFLDLDGLDRGEGLTSFGRQIRQEVMRLTGMPVCVGIGPSKTLAKLANSEAKRSQTAAGVFDVGEDSRRRDLLQRMPVGSVWGIGGRLHHALQQMGIHTALDLAESSPRAMRRQFSVVMERIVRELNGDSCLPLELLVEPRKQIMHSRSFGRPVTTLAEMKQAVNTYVAAAAEKLRDSRRHCKSLSVFIRSGAHQGQRNPYMNTATATLETASSDTRELCLAARMLLLRIWRPGLRYGKAGVVLGDFQAERVLQQDLFRARVEPGRSDELMALVDRINRGRQGRVWFAGQGIHPRWAMRRDHLSPAYTTRWTDIPRVK